MNWKTWAPLVVALVLGLIAAKVGKDMLSQRHGADPAPVQVGRIFVAVEGLSPGDVIKATDLEARQVSAGTVPAGAVTKADDAVGRVLVAPLPKDQPLLEVLLAPAGTIGGLPSMVPAGMRAVTIEVNEFNGVAGMLQPGCRIDIVATMTGEERSDTTSKILVENVKVLAVGRRMAPVAGPEDPSAPAARAITLLASPRDATVIDLATHCGSPRLILRGSGDNGAGKLAGVSLAELRGVPAKTVAATMPAGPRVADAPTTRPALVERTYREVQVIKNTVESTVKLDVGPAPTAAKPAKPAAVVGTGDMNVEIAPDESGVHSMPMRQK